MFRFGRTTVPASLRMVQAISRRWQSHGLKSNKLVGSAKEALAGVNLTGATICVGGFGIGGIPESLLKEISEIPEAKELTVVSLTAGLDDWGVGLLVRNGSMKRIISSYVGENKTIEHSIFNGQMEVELVPMGTIAQRLKSAGAGIPAFFTPTGAGTSYSQGGLPVKFKTDGSRDVEIYSEPKETEFFDGHEFVKEYAMKGDLSIVKAWKADTRGNLVFRGTSRNLNPDCAVAGKFTIVEAEEIVEAGELDPDEIHLPGIYVDKLIKASTNEKRIERLRSLESSSSGAGKLSPGRARVARRAAKEFKDGMYVNLGIGIPTMASNYLPKGVKIELQGENGLLGLGPYPATDALADPDYINPSKESITPLPGASLFSTSESFSMIRGGHVDLTILGGLQCSQSGDLASWIVPGKMLKGMGGAMDLVGAIGSRVVVTMDHTAKDGTPKLLEKCSLPLTGHGVVDRIITDMGVFDVDVEGGTGLTLVEIAPGITVDDVKNATACDFKVVDDLPLMDEE